MSDAILKKVSETEALLKTSEILGAQAERAELLRKKLEDQTITVSVIGQFKRGKSATVNALMGEEIMPTGIVPVTSAVTKISYGEQKSCSIEFENGLVRPIEYTELHSYINEQENPGNALGVASVSMKYPSEFLKGGLTFVDTPGVGSFHKNNSKAAYDFVKESDAVIFMLSVDSPINEIEIDFLINARKYASKFFFAVNKIDTIPEADLKAYIMYCNSLLCSLMMADSVVIFPISAKTGQGLDELRKELQTGLKSRIRDILDGSAVLKLRDIISCSLSQIELYWKVLLMPPVVLKKTLRDMELMLEEYRKDVQNTVHELEADRQIIIPGLADTLKVKLNEFKQSLSAKTTEIFGMDYHYEIQQLEETEEKDKYTLAKVLGDEFLRETMRICDELSATMNKVLMFRNDSTVEVVTRVYDLNTLTRTLKRDLRELENY